MTAQSEDLAWLQTMALAGEESEAQNANIWGMVLQSDLMAIIFGNSRNSGGEWDGGLMRQYNCTEGQLEVEVTFILRRGGCQRKAGPVVNSCSAVILEKLLNQSLEFLESAAYPMWLRDKAFAARYRIGVDAYRRQVQVLLLKAPGVTISERPLQDQRESFRLASEALRRRLNPED